MRDAPLPAGPTCAGPCIKRLGTWCRSRVITGPGSQELDEELRRRIGDAAEILALDGAFGIRATRAPRWCTTPTRARRRGDRDVSAGTPIIVPIRKTPEWWQKSALERHAYFYPHVDQSRGCP